MPVPLGGKLELCGDLVCRGEGYLFGGKNTARFYERGLCVWEKCVFVRVGKAFYARKKVIIFH